MSEPLIQIKDLRIEYPSHFGTVRAVDVPALDIRQGEVLGLVGESGCGKSTLGMALLRMVRRPGYIAGGQVWFGGRDLVGLSEVEMREIRGAAISMIFQDPMTSLDPLQRIEEHLIEAIQVHDRKVNRQQAKERIGELMDRLGIAERRLRDYPHQFSGGMRQRIMIGLALALNAQLIIADEPTTSLDVIVEAQILDLIKELQKAYRLTILLITHNIGIVAELADRVAVMYAGQLVELADAVTFFEDPLHPYTEDLLASVPNINLTDDKLRIMAGSPPDLIHPPTGCRFHPRCRCVMERCPREAPPFAEVRPGHWTACWLYDAAPAPSASCAAPYEREFR
jgi:peptide/nickel transport system ATP-binding protein